MFCSLNIKLFFLINFSFFEMILHQLPKPCPPADQSCLSVNQVWTNKLPVSSVYPQPAVRGETPLYQVRRSGRSCSWLNLCPTDYIQYDMDTRRGSPSVTFLHSLNKSFCIWPLTVNTLLEWVIKSTTFLLLLVWFYFLFFCSTHCFWIYCFWLIFM